MADPNTPLSYPRPRAINSSTVLPPFALAAMNPKLLRYAQASGPSTSNIIRQFGTVSLVGSLARPVTQSILFDLSRFFSSRATRFYTTSSGVSRTVLARAEANANRHPQSASSQSNFYSMLLAASMPQIVIERYMSGHFARNESCDEMYRRAYAVMHPSTPTSTSGGHTVNSSYHGTQSGYNPQQAYDSSQAQAAAQAVAARSRGANIATAMQAPALSAPQPMASPPAAAPVPSPNAPLHVRIDETTGSVIFQWIKFFAYFGLFTYLSLILVTVLIDSFSMMPKRGGTRGQQEVRAENQKARFADVQGCDEAKEELVDLVEFLRNPDKFNTLGGKLPKGVLLVGPPGTGKTLLARAVAGEAGVPFFYMSGSEFDEVYVGVGAKRVRDLFASAKAKAPSIIFIDELDAMGGRRHSRDAAYVKQTLNQLLTELDGFAQNSGVIIIGATNFPESLDRALTRPGRFDRHVVVDLPDARGRIAILKHHMASIKASKDIDVEGIAVTTSGLSGAELANLVNEAAVHASKNKAKEVTMRDFEWAKDRVIMGAERKTMVINPKEKESTAYHEAGHALLRWYTKPEALHKVTVLPRGMTLGHMSQRPDKDQRSRTAADYEQYLLIAYGGYVAEELVFGADKTTDGVSSDIRQATSTAYRMVAQFGMSKQFGPMEFHHMWDNLSSETRAAVEREVREKLSEAYQKAKKLLTDNRKDLDTLAQALLKYETLDREEVGKVLRGEDLPGRVPVPPGPMYVPARGDPDKGDDLGGPGIRGGRGGSGDENNPPVPPPPSPSSQSPRSG